MKRIVICTNKGFVCKSEDGKWSISLDVRESHVFSSKINAKRQAEIMKAGYEIVSYFLMQILED